MLGGKTAIVTGGSGDLGDAMARQLAAQGAHVVIRDIAPPKTDSPADAPTPASSTPSLSSSSAPKIGKITWIST